MSDEKVIQTDEQHVVFELGSEAYAIEIFRVHEIIRLREITSIPRTDAYMRGLVNLRGKTIPVVDLGRRFGLTSQGDGDNTRIIVVESEAGNVGIVVDAVREVMTLETEQVDSAPSLTTSEDNSFVRGVARTKAGLITLLNLDEILAA